MPKTVQYRRRETERERERERERGSQGSLSRDYLF
jgi:hypothetical protein